MKLFHLTMISLGLLQMACADNKHYTGSRSVSQADRDQSKTNKSPLLFPAENIKSKINTGNTTPEELLTFANTLIGIPYQYGSIDPAKGFDCSGFITYVFNHYGIAVPRSSIDFTLIEREISLRESKPGDLILFTGTDSTVRDVGHMGIITENNGRDVSFIHSTSGKANGVTVTPLNKYYQGRFVKAIRIFED